jgi:hypothetical protein
MVLLRNLRLALAHFELGIKPLKTRIVELPAPHDEPWKAEIRRSKVAGFGAGQAHTIGRLKGVVVRDPD